MTQTPPSAGADDQGHSAKLASLQARFLERAAREKIETRRLMAEGDRAGLRRLAHGLAGIAGTFGFIRLGEAARALERVLDQNGDENALTDELNLLDRAIDRAIDGHA